MGTAVTRLAGGFSFLESPRWHDGALYVSDFYTHRVLRVDEAGRAEAVCEVPGQPSGLGFDRQGRLLIVSMTDRRLLRLDGGALDEVADLSALAPYHCNDMLVDASGRAYVGNFGSDVDNDGVVPTCLIMVDAEGRARAVADDLTFPNGMAITSDATTLLVAESFAHRISAYDVGRDGSLSGRRVWASFLPPGARVPTTIEEVLGSGHVAPDGVCMAADDSLWVADACGTGAIRLGPDGRRVQYVDTSPDAVYAVALGGPDGRTLYMCTAPPLGQSDPTAESRSSLLCCRVDVPSQAAPEPPRGTM
jgi:sugar lactone lactonase YvrE